MALVDTHVICELMRRTPDAQVVRWFDRAQDVAVSVITVDEIMSGLTRRGLQPLRQRFDDFLANLQVLDIDHRIARRAGELRGAMAARGIVRSQADMLMAATAQVHALTLVTPNVRDFEGCGIAVLNPFDA